MKNRLLLLLVLSLHHMLLQAQTNSSEIETIIRKVEASLAPSVVYGDSIPAYALANRMKETGIQGLSIAVIKDYRIHWAKAYGWADVERKIPATANTRFQAASISKSINSMGVLLLVQQGKLNAEADINQYFKSWKFPYDSLTGTKNINTLQLLSHTAGLDVHGFPGYKRTDTLPTVVQVLNGQRPANTRMVKSLFAAGTKFKYSGGGTTVSQLMVMDITGKPYARYMHDAVLKPLGMTNSSYEQPPADTANLATGYYSDGKPVTGKYHVYPEQAAAGLWTTPTDLAKYIIECQLALQGRSAKVLNQQMMQLRMTPYIDSNAALGVFVMNKGRKYFNHNGGNEAFLSTSYGSLDGGDGVVIMINGENFSVIDELLNSVAITYDWKGFYKPEFRKSIKLSETAMDKYMGSYQMMQDTLTLERCGNRLCLRQNGQSGDGFVAHFSSEISFGVEEVPSAMFTVLFDADGRVEALELKQRGNVLKLPRIK